MKEKKLILTKVVEAVKQQFDGNIDVGVDALGIITTFVNERANTKCGL